MLILRAHPIISKSPLEVYNSALLQMPRDALLLDVYLHELEESHKKLLVTLQKVQKALPTWEQFASLAFHV
jgi:hypothetical protein